MVLLALAALAWGGVAAYSAWWTTDDAFISFRYARNLVNGSGLVFNEGERVEGFTNLLWTLWIAVGLLLGIAAEDWANAWGLVFYLGSIALLLTNHRRLREEDGGTGWAAPVAALAAAVMPDWNIFATSGLETSLFTFLLILSFLLVVWCSSAPATLAAAGVVAALASLTRPDGILPAFVMGLFLIVTGRPRWRPALLYGVAFSGIWLPATAWRVWYYGDFFPNTYYAKSAYLPYYEQGLRYLWLYAERYWIALLGPVFLLAAWALAHRMPERAWRSATGAARRQASLALALGAAYTFYVVRVGGDFMFARFLIPATPFFLILLELGYNHWLRSRATLGTIGVVAMLAVLRLAPAPMAGGDWPHGVANEWTIYTQDFVSRLEQRAEVLRPYVDGLPLRVAFFGMEARMVYRLDFPVAIESHTGLTDRTVARQEVDRRGRPGHEKRPSIEYLAGQRRAHLTFMPAAPQLLELRGRIPEVIVDFGQGVRGRVLHWDPELMAELGRRGARFPYFTVELDRFIRRLDRLTDEQVAHNYQMLELFYFRHVDDPVREQAFLRRLRSSPRD